MRYLKWLFPALLVLIVTPFTSAIDLGIAHHFYKDGHFLENHFTSFMFEYGERIGFLFGILAALVFSFSFFKPQLKKWRGLTLTIGLTLFLGAGCLINLVLKEYWGRPRPRQLIEFGGTHHYRPYYNPNFQAKIPLKSFPSGHVAMGFSYLTLCYVAYKERRKKLFYLGLGLTVVFGGGLFFSRLAQGGHFFSDALFSIVIMWYTTMSAYRLSGVLLNTRKVLPNVDQSRKLASDKINSV